MHTATAVTGPPAPGPSTRRSLRADLARRPDHVFALGTRAARLADEYGCLQRAILAFCAELPADVLAREDVARVVRRIQQASEWADALARRFLEESEPPPIRREHLDAEGIVRASHDAVREVLGDGVFLHTQIARIQPPILGHRRDLELVFGSLFLLSAAAMPSGGRVHLSVGPDAWAHTRPEEIRGACHVRVRLVDNGGPWADGLLRSAEEMEDGVRDTLIALRAVLARCGGHLTCAKARERGNTVEVLLPAAD